MQDRRKHAPHIQTVFDYSPTKRFLGVIFLILSDSKHAMQNANSINPTPAPAIKPIGTANVHFTMPRLLKNKLNSGFTIKALIINPTIVEMIIAGINDSAVCSISCLVVNPIAFKIP